MSGVIFKITIPTEKYECAIISQIKTKSTADSQSIEEATSVDFIVESDRKPSPKLEFGRKSELCEYLNKQRFQTGKSVSVKKTMKQVSNQK